MDWKREIAIAHLVKAKTAEVDVDGLWDYPAPELAAASDDIERVENQAGIVFSHSHRQFLLHANGWKSFYQSVDLFGSQDYLGGPRNDRSNSLLDSLEDVTDYCGLPRQRIISIAVSMNDIDVFFTAKNPNIDGEKVYWFAGQFIDEFDDFSEFFLSMVDYNRLTFQRLSEKK